MTKYFKSTFTIEVLSTEELGSVSLEDLAYMTTEGHCSGQFTDAKVVELTAEEMRQALIEQGSDPDFLVNEDDE